MKNETCKLYSRVFGIFLPNITINPYNFELYQFKVGAVFLRHRVGYMHKQIC